MPLDLSSSNVHCLVHPGFDAGEHPDFEQRIKDYISDVARTVMDVLLVVSHGEQFSIEQIQQFGLLDMITAISGYIALERRNFSAYDSEGEYRDFLVEEYHLPEVLYLWCKDNIDLSKILEIEEIHREKAQNFDISKVGKEGFTQDDMQKLKRAELEAIQAIDIKALAYKAMQEIGAPVRRKYTSRKLGNPGRFFRLYQHAVKELGSQRVSEIFIHSGEKPYQVFSQPITHFTQWDGVGVVHHHSGIDLHNNELIVGKTYNTSEEETYGNAVGLRDELTAKLSLSRCQNALRLQADKVLTNMGIEIDEQTEFTFFGEYRGRCVSQVLDVLQYRLAPISGDRFRITGDDLTLLKAGD